MFLVFPEFEEYSTPLLLLTLQGLVFAFLLLRRYSRGKNPSDLFLFFILLFTCYGQTCYTVGFMGWYDTYRTTKINYALFNVGLVVAPLIYLYVRSITTPKYKSRAKDIFHFVPFALFFYVAGFIGWSGRAYLLTSNRRSKPEEAEIFIDVLLAIKSFTQGLLWPLLALKELTTGTLTAPMSEVSVSPR